MGAVILGVWYPKFAASLLQGIDARVVEIEIDLDETQLQKEIVVGLPGAAVRESIERVRSAMSNSGYPMPSGRTLINLAPADVRKEGPMYDLPIAVGTLLANGVIHPVRQAASCWWRELCRSRMNPLVLILAGR